MEKRIETQYGTIHAHVEGSGQVILLVHGAHPDNDWKAWEHNVQAMVDAGFSVYALDLLGYGESTGSKVDHLQQAAAILGLLDSESLASAIVGGVSWGGMIALEMALTSPKRVERLILVDSAGTGYYTEAELETIACPTLIVWGEDDTVLSLSNAVWFGAVIPNSQVATIADVTLQEGAPSWAGHHPMRFKPSEFNRILIDFLKS